jgi:hypothetical protein
VFNDEMKRSFFAATAAIAAAAGCAAAIVAVAGSATAATSSTTSTTTTTTTVIGSTVQLGATHSPLVAPACPKGVSAVNCTIVLTESTALESIRDGTAYPTTVTQPGYIVAWTVGLSRLSNNNKSAHDSVHYLDQTFGAHPEAGITVLKPIGPASQRSWQVVAASPIIHVQPWLGYVVQFPLATPLPVTPGEAIALTIPTWAPVLTFALAPNKFAYRQSRTANCGHPAAANQSQTTIGATARYGCTYPGTRVEYSATEVTTPPEPKNQIHASDRRTR